MDHEPQIANHDPSTVACVVSCWGWAGGQPCMGAASVCQRHESPTSQASKDNDDQEQCSRHRAGAFVRLRMLVLEIRGPGSHVTTCCFNGGLATGLARNAWYRQQPCGLELIVTPSVEPLDQFYS
jgi:hypothetical protein